MKTPFFHPLNKHGKVGRYCIARKFHGVKFSQKLIRLSFRDFIFADSSPIAIINDVNIVSQIKIFTGIKPHSIYHEVVTSLYWQIDHVQVWFTTVITLDRVTTVV